MDTLLTLVIALGGIATGIGAIWTAMLARRQLDEQRRFLKEQNEVARRQTELTEESLAQTERSLTEQNDRARLTLEYDLHTRMFDRLVSPYYLRQVREASECLRDNAFVGEDIVELPSFPKAVSEVCDFFEGIGELLRRGVLSAETVWNQYGHMARAYWLMCKPTIEKVREGWEEPKLYEDFEYLYRVLAELDHERGVPAPNREQLRQFMEMQATIDERPPTTPE